MSASGRVLLVGVGGLGAPLALVLSRAEITLGLADDDDVDRTNLQRQILFDDADVGRSKLLAARDALLRLGARCELVFHETRLLPHNALELVSGFSLVVEGSDNFATKFLVADACAIAGVPVVHGAAVRWHGTALAVGPSGRPCYRCLFEDIPRENAPNCAEAGVMGPVVGVVGALQADLALRALGGEAPWGELVTYDGRADVVRRRTIPRRADCPLCGDAATIRDIELARYVSGECEA